MKTKNGDKSKNDQSIVFIYFLPSVKSDSFFWRSYSIQEKDTYDKIITSFVTDYQSSRKVAVNKKSLVFFALDPFTNFGYKILNFDEPVRYSEFCVFFSAQTNDVIYASEEISKTISDNGFFFFKKKNYSSSINFFHYIKNKCFTEVAKMYYYFEKWEEFKKTAEDILENVPNPEVVQLLGKFYENNEETEKAMNLYKKYRNKFPICNVIYQRHILSHDKQQYVNEIVKEALLDTSTHLYSTDLLLECAKLYVKNGQFQEACQLCLLNREFMINCIDYFSTVNGLTKLYRVFVTELKLPPVTVGCIIRKILKNRQAKNALKLAEQLFQSNRYNFFCTLTYIDILLRCYDFDRLTDVVALFFTILPKRLGKFDVEKIASVLQSSSTFRTKTFNPTFNLEYDYCGLDYEPDDELNFRLKLSGNARIKHPDMNKIIHELCSEENMKSFEIILMAISVFFYVIGDVATFKSITNTLGGLITFDSRTVPFIFLGIQQLYQSAVNMRNFAVPLPPNSMNILAVGDVHSISSCNLRMKIRNENYYVTSLPIADLAVYDLRPESDNYRKELFFRFVKKGEQFSKLLLVIGTKDCERIIPKLVDKMKFTKFPFIAAIQKIVDIYFDVIKDIHVLLPSTNLVVHAALPRFQWSEPIVYNFNELLKQKIDNKFPFVSPIKKHAKPEKNLFPATGFIDGLPDGKYANNLKLCFE